MKRVLKERFTLGSSILLMAVLTLNAQTPSKPATGGAKPTPEGRRNVPAAAPRQPPNEAAMNAIATEIAHIPNGPCWPTYKFAVTIISIVSYDSKSRSWPARASVVCSGETTRINLGERTFRLYRDAKGITRARYVEEEEKKNEDK
jgi:hypothetical protein